MQNSFVRNKSELKALIKAAQIIDETYDLVLKSVRAGVSEIEISDLIEKSVLSLGGSGVSFETIVAFGESGAEPHHVPTDKKLEDGMLVTVDMGAVYEGMCSDFTRTFAFGTPSEKQLEIYRCVYRAQKLALSAVAAGESCKLIDAVARDYISAAGYGEFYIHGTGHGVGKLIHEPPTLNAKSEELLENDMVVTIEPGIYLPSEMGVRIEDMIVVGTDKPVSGHSTELIVLDAR